MTAQEEKEYTRHFNNGYLLAKHEPKLFAQIAKGNDKVPGLQAMKEGAKQLEREKVREEFKRIDAEKGKDRSKESEKEI